MIVHLWNFKCARFWGFHFPLGDQKIWIHCWGNIMFVRTLIFLQEDIAPKFFLLEENQSSDQWRDFLRPSSSWRFPPPRGKSKFLPMARFPPGGKSKFLPIYIFDFLKFFDSRRTTVRDQGAQLHYGPHLKLASRGHLIHLGAKDVESASVSPNQPTIQQRNFAWTGYYQAGCRGREMECVCWSTTNACTGTQDDVPRWATCLHQDGF